MQTTPNYSFKLPEGTDIVNPLVDMNPNWSSLDTKLKATDDKTVFGPSCTKSGTVFAVSALSLTVCIFRITAPARWNAGDSMTVGGNAVSVKMTDGTTPADGVFDTGSQVICIKYGNQITIVGTNKTIPTASEVTTTAGDTVQNELDSLGGVIKIFESGDYVAGATWVLPQEALDYMATGKAFILEADVFWGGTYSSARVTKVITRGFGGHTACILNRSDPQVGMLRINNTSFDAYGYDLEYAPIIHNLYMFPLGTN